MKFAYEAKDRKGAIQQGEIDGASVLEVRHKLRSQGLFVLRIASAADGLRAKSVKAGSTGGRVRKVDLLLMMSQLTIMCQSGVDLAEALQNLAQQSAKPALRLILEAVHRDVSDGVSFSEALRRHPRVFDEAFIAGIAAGERSGTILAVLDRLTHLIRGEIRLRSTVWSMLMYPLVLCGVTCLVLVSMIFFVLPQFAKVFADLGKPAPPLTQMLLDVGDFARDNLLVIAGVTVTATVVVFMLRSTPVARQCWDAFALHAVLIRHSTRALATGRIFRLLGTMLQSGVPLVECVRLCRGAAGNSLFQQMFDTLERDLLNGRGIAATFSAATFLPTGAAHMVATAERTGKLGPVLQTVGEYYEDEGERQLRDVIRILEPAIILSLGAMVAVIVLSVVLPLLDVSTMSH